MQLARGSLCTLPAGFYGSQELVFRLCLCAPHVPLLSRNIAYRTSNSGRSDTSAGHIARINQNGTVAITWSDSGLTEDNVAAERLTVFAAAQTVEFARKVEGNPPGQAV